MTRVKTSREKRRARKASNAARFEESEKENTTRFEGLHPHAQQTTPRASTDPFRDSREVEREDRAQRHTNPIRRSADEARTSRDDGGDVGGSLRRGTNGTGDLEGQERNLIEERGPPPDYNSLDGAEREKKKGLKGKIFGRRGTVEGDSVIR